MIKTLLATAIVLTILVYGVTGSEPREKRIKIIKKIPAPYEPKELKENSEPIVKWGLTAKQLRTRREHNLFIQLQTLANQSNDDFDGPGLRQKIAEMSEQEIDIYMERGHQIDLRRRGLK